MSAWKVLRTQKLKNSRTNPILKRRSFEKEFFYLLSNDLNETRTWYLYYHYKAAWKALNQSHSLNHDGNKSGKLSSERVTDRHRKMASKTIASIIPS